ncbi:FHA domain-containing protein, partial [Alpinimonas psychrophila]
RITDGAAEAPHIPRSTVVFFLRTVTGERYSLSTAVVFGRAPRVARIPGGDVVQLVSLPSREGRVSTTHVELRQIGGVVVVTDLRSTNGTRVTLASGVSRQLAPGDSMAIGEGAVVDIGDGNRIDVMRETTRDASNDIAR